MRHFRYLITAIAALLCAVNAFAQTDQKEKYYPLTPYMYYAGSPIIFSDKYGLFLFINEYQFINGALFDMLGNVVDINDLDDFSFSAYISLNQIYQTETGKVLIDDLQYSDFTFKITESQESSFKQFDTRGAFALNNENALPNQIVGSGGVVYWNPSGAELFTRKGSQVNATTDLAHELFHAMDANHGVLDNREYRSLQKSEWQAVYNENLLRKEMRLPLRTHYRKYQYPDGSFSPAPPRMLRWGKPIKPKWY